MRNARFIAWRPFDSRTIIGVGTVCGIVCGLAIGLVLTRTTLRPSAARADSAPAGETSIAAGKLLYEQHCLQCHGQDGDGNGPAARFLYPRPRNFGEAKFRLVTTGNSIPTDEDLMRVITRGMPGSAMFPFGHLSEMDRKNLVAYMRDLTRRSFILSVQRSAAARGEKVDLPELERDAVDVLKPGDAVEYPANWANNDAESVARGKKLYMTSCASCHGDTGKGDGVQEQKNNDGTPNTPRDFTRGIFKGGRERESLFARIRLGMAGTPMPGLQDATPEQLSDLIHFIQSLSNADDQAKVEHKRSTVTASRRATLPEFDSDSAWASVPATRVVVSPLWWRNYAEPELTIRALHDGKTLAIRMTWRDDSRDDRIVKPEDFEDMAAVQLFAGKSEPFLGMGTAEAPIDLWLWRSSWQRPREYASSILDDYPFDVPFYVEFLKKRGQERPDFQTARAAGNPQARGDEKQTGSNLGARGFGSTTFYPKPSQLVTTKSGWKDGRWTVELRRPIAAGADGGLSLNPGGQCSVAFALWDGAVRDRNGQKLVSIWHDLVLEK